MVLHIIAAACENMGIGHKGQLPWRLKKEMAYFTEKTSATQNPGKQNAVIMGRKTWESIPKKMRPLPNRINVVLTTSLSSVEGAHHTTDSFEKAMAWLQEPTTKEKLDKVFVIGGESVYRMAMESEHPQVIYLTRILETFECDTFFPKLDEEKYSITKCEGVPEEVQEENGLRYKFEVYKTK
ncbi:hypothetical protein JTE90_017110 [Oedothorax gibbosus]|uniref:dihydrofolate reductase n=1 Tax=Oedothorax gibbosus TaxID=931172 RepID=A0AAV6UGY8_9ARAC|nr:hypothetical protein JTE90_017110 [Oedothorax gibbosus]